MSQIVIDENKRTVQCFRFPRSGATTVLTTVVGSVASGPLSAGIYRVVATGTVNIAKGATATANDAYVLANMPEHFLASEGDTVAVYSAVAGTQVYLTRM